MTELKHEIYIQASPQKVWAVLADLEAVKYYNPTVADAHYISLQKEGVGASRECRLKPKGKVKERIIGWEPGKAVSMELYESDWPVRNMKWRTEVNSSKDGSLVTQKLEYEPKGLIGSVVNFIIMKRMMNKNIGEVFEKLKNYVENQ